MDEPINQPIEDSNEGIVNEYKPRIGMTFSSEPEAYAFYNRFGGSVGFSIRRAYAHKLKEDKNIIKQRTFVCCKEGVRGKDKRDIHTSKPRGETRTGCLARMCISRLDNGHYECRSFVDEHNHELHTAETTHFMRSQRVISRIDALAIDLADESGIRPKATFEYLGMQVGGREHLGYTRQDLKNYLRTKRQKDMVYGEAGGLNVYLSTQKTLNPSFTYSFQYDVNEQVANIFWADPRMIIDYALFGDVISFDTTFCTNKAYRPLAIFAGFNHHRGVTIFGAALMYDETIDSFTWLFERFLEAHGQKKPVTIFTDQDPAMAKAISDVFIGTRHGLCTWHLMQNAIKNLSHLMKEGSHLLTDLKKCVYHYENASTFEAAWKKLREDYPVHENSWLDRTYEIKEKWAKCYMKETVTLGMRSTQVSESFNADLKEYLGRTLNFTQFFTHFERVVEAKRANELKAEFEARDKIPKSMGSKAPILRHAGKVYTPYAYNQFLEEYNWINACYITSRVDSIVLSQYMVRRINEEGDVEEGEYLVMYNPSEHAIYCSCKKFETIGILCCHALKIFVMHDVMSIPEEYILHRWTRAVRNLVLHDNKGSEVKEDVRLDCTKRFKYLCPKFVRIATKASNSIQGFDLANKAASKLSEELDKLDDAVPIVEASAQELDANKNLKLKKKEVKKGGKKRHKSCLEKTMKRKKTNKLQPPSQVPTPIQRNSMSPLMPMASSQASAATLAFSQASVSTIGPSQESNEAAGFYQHFL